MTTTKKAVSKPKKMLKHGKNVGVVKLSHTSKMPCDSWSLEAGSTCPGAKYNNGTICGICSHCYACKGFYRMDNATKVRRANWKAWQADSFVSDFIQALDRVELFRWFDSGDIANKALAEKIYQICLNTPHCKHWIPTKSYTVESILPIIKKLEALPNVTVRRSAKEIDTDMPKDGTLTCTVNSSPDSYYGVQCPAYKNNGKCGSCRACWNKNISNISYLIH